MDSYGYAGLAAGLERGVDLAVEGVVTAQQIKERRQRIQQQAEEADLNRQVTQQNLDVGAAKLKEAELRLSELEGQVTRQEIFSYWDAYTEYGDVKSLNQVLRLPAVQKKNPDAVRFDSIRTAEPQMLESRGLTKQMIDADPYRYVVSTNKDGSRGIIDMYQVYVKRGYMNRMSQNKIDKMVNATKAATAEIETEKADITLEAIKSRDPVKIRSALQLTNPELFTKLDSSGGMSDFTKELQVFYTAHPDATEEDVREFANQYSDKRMKGVEYNKTKALQKEAKTSMDESVSLVDSVDTNKYLSDESYRKDVNKQARDLEVLNLKNHPAKASYIKTKETMESNKMFSDMIADIVEKDLPDVDRDAEAYAETFVETKLGIKAKKAMDEVNFNSKAGRMLAAFIKAISGAQATDAEYQRLKGILLGGDLTDDLYVERAMRSFKQSLDLENSLLRDRVKAVMPETAIKTIGRDIKDDIKAKVDMSTLKTSGSVDLSKFVED